MAKRCWDGPLWGKNIYMPVDVSKALADVFGTTIVYLVMGDTESKAQTSLKEKELLNLFKKISNIPE